MTRGACAEGIYVLGFAPWGWVIGTGMYTDDVREEIQRLERGILALSIAIALLVGAFLAWLVWQSLRLERERTQSEDRLRESHERFRALVEAAREGTLHVRAGRCLYANPTLLEWLGYRAGELPLLHFRDLIEDRANAPGLRALDALGGPGGVPPGCEAVLRRRDGQRVPCALGFSRMGPGLEAGFVVLVRALFGQTDDIGEEERLTRLSRAADAIPHGRLPCAHRPIRPAARHEPRDPRFFARRRPCRRPRGNIPSSGAWASSNRNSTKPAGPSRCSLERGPDGPLRLRLAAIKTPSPGGEPGWMDGTVRDAGVEWAIEEARARRLARDLASAFETAPDAVSVSRALARAKGLARVLMEGEARPRAVSSLLAEASDAAVRKLIALAQGEIGPAPAPFAFLALGSHGRREQTLGADQDNASYGVCRGRPRGPISLSWPGVCEGLERGDQPRCKGGSMR
jgi:PAS domain S-box-containing protein